MTGDRRTSPRYQFPGTVEIVSQGFSERLLAEVRNISLGGCYILMKDPLNADAVVHLKFSLGATEFEIAGVVRNRKLGHGMGVQFDTQVQAPIAEA
jgi:hypothetical protein